MNINKNKQNMILSTYKKYKEKKLNGINIPLKLELKNVNATTDVCMYYIIRFIFEEELGYTKNTIRNLKEEELKQYKDVINKSTLSFLRKVSLFKKVEIEDIVNFIYPNTFTLEERVKKTYMYSYKNNTRLDCGIIYNNKDKAEQIFYYLLEVALETDGIKIADDEIIYKTITINWLKEKKLRSHFNALYNNLGEMLRDQFYL